MTTSSKTHATRITAALALALAPLGAACGEVATEDYKGEPLFQLQGEVRSSLEEAPPTFKMGVVYMSFQPDDSVLLRHVPAEVAGEFPARFSVTIHEPPPADMLQNQGFANAPDLKVAPALLVAAPELPEGVSVLAPGGDPLILADELGWVAVAPIQVLYYEGMPQEMIDAQQPADEGLVLKNGFNAIAFDMEAEFARVERAACVNEELADDSSELSTCQASCNPDEESEILTGGVCGSCATASCGADAVPVPRGIGADDEITLDLGRDWLALERAKRAAGT